jgi:hypothetical protein
VNRVAGLPTVSAWATPSTATVGQTVTLGWTSDASGVEITGPRGETMAGPAEGTRTFVVTQPGVEQFSVVGLDSGRRSAPRIVPVTVLAPDRPGDDATPPGGDGDVTCVVIRPYVLVDGEATRVDADLAHETASRITRMFGAGAQVIELPWVEDELAVLAGSLGRADDPRTTLLLEAIDRAAARTPGRENALWIALVPDGADHQPPLGVVVPGQAALAVAVVSPGGAVPTFARMLQHWADDPPPTTAFLLEKRAIPAFASMTTNVRGPATRLRIVGDLVDRSVRLVDLPRIDTMRAAGPGAPIETGLTALCLDARGREIPRTSAASAGLSRRRSPRPSRRSTSGGRCRSSRRSPA